MIYKHLTAGPPLATAPAAMILIHGRGASADSMLRLYEVLDVPHIAAIAPQAPAGTWYPQSFLAPLPANQPSLDQSLAQIQHVIDDLLAAGRASQSIALLGFSQGACLACEIAARNPRRYGAVIAFTGGLIGPPGTPRNYPGDLAGTPIFLGTSDPDPHVPLARVEETRDVFQQMGAIVDFRRYPGLSHTIDQDEIEAARAMLAPLSSRAEN